jgi:hypothetical protein
VRSWAGRARLAPSSRRSRSASSLPHFRSTTRLSRGCHRWPQRHCQCNSADQHAIPNADLGAYLVSRHRMATWPCPLPCWPGPGLTADIPRRTVFVPPINGMTSAQPFLLALTFCPSQGVAERCGFKIELCQNGARFADYSTAVLEALGARPRGRDPSARFHSRTALPRPSNATRRPRRLGSGTPRRPHHAQFDDRNRPTPLTDPGQLAEPSLDTSIDE